MTNIDELLAIARALLKTKPPVGNSTPKISYRPNFAIAFRATRCYQFLTHKRPDEIKRSHLIHVYPEPDTEDTPSIMIIHNHPRHLDCSAPLFCYEHGYQPTGAENPDFIQLFKEKNAKAY